jgi:hypothetical protein
LRLNDIAVTAKGGCMMRCRCMCMQGPRQLHASWARPRPMAVSTGKRHAGGCRPLQGRRYLNSETYRTALRSIKGGGKHKKRARPRLYACVCADLTRAVLRSSVSAARYPAMCSRGIWIGHTSCPVWIRREGKPSRPPREQQCRKSC